MPNNDAVNYGCCIFFRRKGESVDNDDDGTYSWFRS